MGNGRRRMSQAVGKGEPLGRGCTYSVQGRVDGEVQCRHSGVLIIGAPQAIKLEDLVVLGESWSCLKRWSLRLNGQSES